MKKRSMFSIVLIILGGLVIIIPWFLFPACDRMMELASGNSAPMKCHWTAVMTSCLGVLATANGILCMFTKISHERALLAIISCLLGIAIVLTPTVLIGVCSSVTMRCHMAMQPALVIGGSGIIVVSVTGILADIMKNKQDGII